MSSTQRSKVTVELVVFGDPEKVLNSLSKVMDVHAAQIARGASVTVKSEYQPKEPEVDVFINEGISSTDIYKRAVGSWKASQESLDEFNKLTEGDYTITFNNVEKPEDEK